MCQRVPLSKGKFALVSDEDYERVSQYKWTYDAGYACRKVTWHDEEGKTRKRKVLLHRFITDAPANMEVDHRNWDGLDNRRDNLRIATHTQNRANARPRAGCSSRYKGVWLDKRDGVWRSEIVVDGKRNGLGIFNNEDDAARAYNAAALKAWGEFTYLNPVSIHLGS